MPPRRKLSPEEVEAMMVPELVKAIYPVLIQGLRKVQP